jgi:hypothetical protein
MTEVPADYIRIEWTATDVSKADLLDALSASENEGEAH